MSRGGAPSRSQQAFSWLLSGDGEGGGRGGGRRGGQPAQPSGSKSKSKRRGSRSGSGADYIPGFQLRSDAEEAAAAAAAAAAGGGRGSELDTLLEVFGAVLGADVVADVLAACGGDAAAASDTLLALGGGGEGGGQSAAAEAGGAGSSAAAAADEEEGAAGRAPAGGPCYWDVLPAELKGLVFDQLSLRDLARAARAYREFASYVREQRRSLKTVIVPEGVSYTAVRGLVAAFTGATGVVLARCAAQLRFPHEWEGMLGALALGEADRRGGTPISYVSLAKCGGADEAVVAALCETFGHLQRVDLSRCPGVGDAALARLAAYTRQPDAGGDAGGGWEDEDADEGEGAAAAAAGAMQGLHLARHKEGSAPGSPRAAPAAAAAPSAAESPDSAVRRIAAQNHARELERSAEAQRAQHGRPRAPGLRELCLRETSVSARGVKLLLQPGSATAKSLQVLDVSRCPNLGGDALDLHPRCCLQVLRASGCNALRSVVIQLPADAPLRTLSLESCRQLHELHLVAHRLQAASLSHCGQLRQLSMRCRRLRELRAVNCGSLSLTASELHCPALRDVNLFGCREVDAEGLEAVAPSLAQCTRLDLTGCTSLSRVLLPDSPLLQSVSVSGCGVLRQVLLASPALTRFRAAGCGRLMELRVGTVSLQQLDLENCANLREVQVSEASQRPSLLGGGGRAGEGGDSAAPKRALVLKGCTHLSDAARQRLHAAVLGAP